MKYIQFYTLSTGYIEGSIPPRFDDSHKKPIPACGSDSVLPLDGRYSRDNHIIAALSYAKRHKNTSQFTGFKLMQGGSYSNARAISDYIVID